MYVSFGEFMPEQPFGHGRPADVSGAKEEDMLFHAP
jgi:hypothetical protein